ncbi:MAG: hypothetical protein PVJ98_10365 [Akkermansiaceae bacterium]|jgi:hypothetical protein
MSEIPPLFHSLEHDGPFRRCLTCGKDFREIDEPYNITKVFRGTECVFEYAICQSCRLEQLESFSEESRQTMEDFFEENEHLQSREERLEGNENYEDRIKECATCGTSLDELKEYSLGCVAFDDHMVVGHFPMMICAKCESELQSRLSKSTRDQWDRFISENFDGPPADALKPDGVPMLV